MDPMTSALRELANMDELAGRDSFLHRIHPLTKLLVTVIYIFTVVSFPADQLSGLIPMVLIPVILYQLAGIGIGTCFYKLRFVLPLVCAVGIWNPILNRTPVMRFGSLIITAGMISFVTLMLKGVLSLMASFLLIATTNIEKICYALRLLHVPELVVTQTLITYRYISLLLREAGTIVTAYTLRAPGQKGVHYSAWGSLLGQLLLRSMDRAEALYRSMQLRGFTGSFYYADVLPVIARDVFFGLVMVLCIGFLRYFPLVLWLGGLFG